MTSLAADQANAIYDRLDMIPLHVVRGLIEVRPNDLVVQP